MVIGEKTLTPQEFWAQYAGREARYELVRGVPVPMPPVGYEHGNTAVFLVEYLAPYVRQHDLGRVNVEVGYRLGLDTVRAPDVAFVAKARLAQLTDPQSFVPFAPDLAVEVVSPSETASDIHDKVRDYRRAGTRLIWVIYPGAGEVVVHYPDGSAQTLTADDTLSGGEVIPGFALAVKALFDE